MYKWLGFSLTLNSGLVQEYQYFRVRWKKTEFLCILCANIPKKKTVGMVNSLQGFQKGPISTVHGLSIRLFAPL